MFKGSAKLRIVKDAVLLNNGYKLYLNDQTFRVEDLNVSFPEITVDLPSFSISCSKGTSTPSSSSL